MPSAFVDDPSRFPALRVAGVIAVSVLSLFLGLASVPSHAATSFTFTPCAGGLDPVSIAAGDLSGDGVPDLVLANYTRAGCTLLIGNGSGGVASSRFVLGGYDLRSATIGQLNGGLLDFVAVDFTAHSLYPFLNRGDGTFPEPVPIRVGLNPFCVRLGDFNRDGRTDAVTANRGQNTITLLHGNGDGTFAPRLDYPVGDTPHEVSIGDLNGDGWMDVGCSNYESGTISILLGNGGGGLSPAVHIPVGFGVAPVLIADLDGDVVPDVAFGRSGFSEVGVMLGDGTGALGAPTYFPTTTFVQHIVSADFNMDSKPDLAMTCIPGSILLGNGDGTFAPAEDFSAGPSPSGLVVADLDGDHRADLAASNLYTPSSSTASIMLNRTEPPTADVPFGGAELQLALYPNPATSSASIQLDLPVTTRASLGVFDAAGRKAATLASGELAPGAYRFVWRGEIDGVRRAEAGIYFVRLDSPAGIRTRRFVWLSN